MQYRIKNNWYISLEGQFYHGGEYSFTVPYDPYTHAPISAQLEDMLFDRSLHFQIGIKRELQL